MRDYRSVYRYVLGLTRSGGDAEYIPLRRSSVPFTRGQVHSATIALTTGAQDDIGTLPIDGELSGISIPGASGWLWMNGGFYGTANQGVDWQDLLLERWVANGHVVDAMLTESGSATWYSSQAVTGACCAPTRP